MESQRYVVALRRRGFGVDPEAEGTISTREDLPKLLKLLETGIPEKGIPHVRTLAREEMAGEEDIDPRELRLPELPDGTFSRFLGELTSAGPCLTYQRASSLYSLLCLPFVFSRLN